MSLSPTATTAIRAVALLQAKPGQEQALRDFTVGVLPSIQQAEGLYAVEFSCSLAAPPQMILYYAWRSLADSERYLAGPIYAQIAPRLHALIADRSLTVAEFVWPRPA